MSKKPAGSSVLVVGGGYGGRAVAKALDSHLDVTLVTEREQFLHNVPALRAVAVDGYADKLLIGYDKLLRHGRVMHAHVDELDDAGATLADGTRINANYLVVATGSSYPFPGKAEERASSDILARVRATDPTAIDDSVCQWR